MLDFSLRKNLSAADGPMTLDIQVQLSWGKVINLYGPSGAGKTSILRMLAGLMQPDQGWIKIKQESWYDSAQHFFKKPKDRHLGFIFQDYALFPNMTVRENLLFALDRDSSKKTVDELIDLIELGSLQDRKPATLSGGQKQRVALARALVRKPDLLLLDEPLSALDHAIRKKLQQYILDLHTKYDLTTILVSHDLNEIMAMADVVIRLEKGKIVEMGELQEIQFETQEHIVRGNVTEVGEDRRGHFVLLTNGVQTEKVYYVPEKENFGIGDRCIVKQRFSLVEIERETSQ